MVQTYLVLVALCWLTSEARIFIGDCSLKFCEQECRQHEKMKMECYCKRGYAIKEDGRKCVKSDDTDDNLEEASGEEASGREVEISNCDNEDGDCDTTTLIELPSSSGDDEDGSGILSSKKKGILPSTSAILPDGTATAPDNIPHILFFSFEYPIVKCFGKLFADPVGFSNTLRYQIALAASLDENSLTHFQASCGSIDVRTTMIKSNSLSVADGVKRLRNLVTNGKLDVTIDGQTIKAITTSFTALKDPTYPIVVKGAGKTSEKPIQVSTIAATEVKTLSTRIDGVDIKSTQTFSKSVYNVGETIVSSIDNYVTSRLPTQTSVDVKKASQTPSTAVTFISVDGSPGIPRGLITSMVKQHPSSSTMHITKSISHGSSAGQSSLHASLPLLRSVSTTLQEVLPPMKTSTSAHTSLSKSISTHISVSTSVQEFRPPLQLSSTTADDSLSTSASAVQSISTTVREIPHLVKPSSTDVRKSLSTSVSVIKPMSTSVEEMYPPLQLSSTGAQDFISTSTSVIKSMLTTTVLEIRTSQIPPPTGEYTNVSTSYRDAISFRTSSLVKDESARTTKPSETMSLDVQVPEKSVMSSASAIRMEPTPLKTITLSSSTLLVPTIYGDGSAKLVPSKQTSSVSKATLRTSTVDVEEPDFMSTSKKLSVSVIVASSEIKFDGVVGQTNTPVVTARSSTAFKKTIQLDKVAIQTSKPDLSREVMQSTYRDEIRSSSSKPVTETEPIVRVITFESSDEEGKPSRENRLLANSYVMMILSPLIIYLLVLH